MIILCQNQTKICRTKWCMDFLYPLIKPRCNRLDAAVSLMCLYCETETFTRDDFVIELNELLTIPLTL